jgi:hypothetical protein
MAVTFTKILQGVSPTTIEATDILQFAGASFNSPVFVDAYQDTTHVKTSVGVDKSTGNTPNNVKFISQAGGTGGDSQADWGDGTEDLDQITEAEATLKLTVSNASNITTADAVFYSYDPGATIADPLAGIDVRAAEVGDANFTECEGSAAALALADQSTPATSHDFYIAISKSPTTNGLLSDTLRFETVVV